MNGILLSLGAAFTLGALGAARQLKLSDSNQGSLNSNPRQASSGSPSDRSRASSMLKPA